MGVSPTPLLEEPSKSEAAVTAPRFSRRKFAHVLQGEARRHSPLPEKTLQRKATPGRSWKGKRRPRMKMKRTRWRRTRSRRKMKKTTISWRKATTRSRKRERTACGKSSQLGVVKVNAGKRKHVTASKAVLEQGARAAGAISTSPEL